MAENKEFMAELKASMDNNAAVSNEGDLSNSAAQSQVAEVDLERMHFSEFQEKYSTAVEAEQSSVLEAERAPLPIPEYDNEAHGWMVPGRPDLGVKRTDMALWTALAKEQGVEIYLRRPEVAENEADHQNQVNGPAVRELSLRPEQGTPLIAPEARNDPGAVTMNGPGVAPSTLEGQPTKLEPPLGAASGIEGPEKADASGLDESAQARRMLHDVLDEPPELVRKRYLYAEGHYYFRDRNNNEAFVDKGPGLSTGTNDPVVASSMLEVAQAKGWQSIRISGSPEFMKEIWYQAQLRGMEIQGYNPDPLDLARLEDAKARGLVNKPGDINNQIEAVGENRPAPEKPVHNLMQGVIVGYGRDAFNHDKREGVSKSYFISLRNDDGKITTHWGKDLERLVTQHDLKQGQRVELARLGKRDVEVMEPVHDKNGKKIDEKPKLSHLNEWAVAKLDSPTIQTPAVDPARAERIAAARTQLDGAIDKGLHPELFGAVQAYRIEKAHLAQQNITEPQKDSMLNIARGQLAERIADGQSFGLPGEKPLSPGQIDRIAALSTVVREKFLAEGGENAASVDVYWDTMSAGSKLIQNGVALPELSVKEHSPGLGQPVSQPPQKLPMPEAPKPKMAM